MHFSHKSMNAIGELKCRETEQEFVDYSMKRSLSVTRVLILFSGIILVLWWLLELFRAIDDVCLLYSLLLRLVVFAVSAVLFFTLKNIKKNNILNALMLGYMIIYVAAYTIIGLMLPKSNTYEVLLTFILIFSGMLLLQIRWIFLVIGGVILSAIYILIVTALNASDSDYNLFNGMLLFFVGLAFIATSSYLTNVNKRAEFIERKKLEAESVTDRLTGAFNRNRLDQALNEWISLHVRYNLPFSVIMFDLDNFKQVNDRYGHIVGDQVLCDCVAKVRSAIRNQDILARWGGEEFIVLLPQTKKKPAVELAERIRHRLENFEHPSAGKVTCSFGVTQANQDDTAGILMERVDALLYHAKINGRNRVESQEETLQAEE